MTMSNAYPKISVVVPFFNVGGFLREAIESVLTQTYSDWELILVDDGSTDDGSAIAESFASNSHGRIIYLEHPGHENRGMPASRNLGIKNSHGQYIAQLDSDDIWCTDFLETFVSIMDTNSSVAMTFGPMKVWRNWKCLPDGPPDWVQSFTFRCDKVLPPPSFVPLLLTGKNDPQGCVLRRSAVEEVGLYEESLAMCEDWALYFKIALKYDILPINKCCYWYRQHPAQFCSQARQSGTLFREYLPFIVWLKSYLASVRCNDPEVMSSISKFVWRNRFFRAGEFALHRLKNIQAKFSTMIRYVRE